MNLHAVAGTAFGAFVLAVAAVVLAESRLRAVRRGGSAARQAWRRRARALRAAQALLVMVVLGASLLSVLSQRNLWPFSNWALMTGAPRRDMGVEPTYLRLAVVGATGEESRVDFRAVEPFAFEELMAWMRKVFVGLPPAAQDSAARYLLARINEARSRVRAGDPPGTQQRWLGPLRAPFHLLHPKRWTAPDVVPDAPFVALRVYSATWDLVERARDPAAYVETLAYEFRVGAP